MLHAFLKAIKANKTHLATSVHKISEKAILAAIEIPENSTNIDTINNAWEKAANLKNTILGKIPLIAQTFCDEHKQIESNRTEQKRSQERELKRKMSRNSIETAALIELYAAKTPSPLSAIHAKNLVVRFQNQKRTTGKH